MSRPRVLFVCDAGLEVGGGHVMRSLTLAGALHARRATCAFLATEAAAAGVLDRFDTIGCERVKASASTAAELAEVAGEHGGGFDAVVLDHFGFGEAEDARARRSGARLAAIDDLADRPRDVDLLLDPSFGRAAGDYGGLLPERAVRLLGPAYALVRPEFAAVRPVALQRRGQRVERALVALGLTDVGGITRRVLDALGGTRGVALDVVLGAAAPSLAAVRALADADPAVQVHVESRDMAAMTAQADVAIGAGGSSTWERACLGLPTITLVLADNQAPLAAALERAGVTAVVDVREAGWEDRLRESWAALLDDADLRARFAGRSAALTDGLGSRRAADALLAMVSRVG